jgi:hypothetical protein
MEDEYQKLIIGPWTSFFNLGDEMIDDTKQYDIMLSNGEIFEDCEVHTWKKDDSGAYVLEGWYLDKEGNKKELEHGLLMKLNEKFIN